MATKIKLELTDAEVTVHFKDGETLSGLFSWASGPELFIQTAEGWAVVHSDNMKYYVVKSMVKQ